MHPSGPRTLASLGRRCGGRLGRAGGGGGAATASTAVPLTPIASCTWSSPRTTSCLDQLGRASSGTEAVAGCPWSSSAAAASGSLRSRQTLNFRAKIHCQKHVRAFTRFCRGSAVAGRFFACRRALVDSAVAAVGQPGSTLGSTPVRRRCGAEWGGTGATRPGNGRSRRVVRMLESASGGTAAEPRQNRHLSARGVFWRAFFSRCAAAG